MITLVTAIYNHDPLSVYGGRGRGVGVYLPSLINISKLGVPLVVYAPKDAVEKIVSVLSPYFNKLKVVPCELATYEFHDVYLNMKAKWKVQINDRNGILCHMKPYWLKNVAESNPFNTTHFMWIDAGLTHHGIFPERVGGVELAINHPASFYYPENDNNIFRPELGYKLFRWMNSNKILSACLPYAGESSVLMNSVGRNGTIRDHVIGGFFGGNQHAISKFFAAYRQDLIDLVFVNKFNVLEEQIFSISNVLRPDMFDLKRFSTWWYFSPGERCSYLQSEGDSFYKIFI